MSASAICVAWKSASGLPNCLRASTRAQRLVERARRHAERRGADRGAEEIERRHGQREAAALLAEERRGRARARRRASRCRSGAARSARVGSTRQPRRPARRRRKALRPRWRSSEVRANSTYESAHAGVGDEALRAVDDVAVAVAHGARRDGADVAAGLGLGDGEGADGLAVEPRCGKQRAASARRCRRASPDSCRGPAWRTWCRRATSDSRAPRARRTDRAARRARAARHSAAGTHALQEPVSRQPARRPPARRRDRSRGRRRRPTPGGAIAQRDVPLLEEPDHRPLELRLALGDERFVGLAEVARRPCRSAAPAPRPRAPLRATCRARGSASPWSCPSANERPAGEPRRQRARLGEHLRPAATTRLVKPISSASAATPGRRA